MFLCNLTYAFAYLSSTKIAIQSCFEKQEKITTINFLADAVYINANSNRGLINSDL